MHAKRLFDWQRLRAVGGMQAMRVIIFIPIFGYFLIFNEYTSSVLYFIHKSHSNDNTNLVVNPLINLYLLYYGGFFLSIGQVIYNIYCPANIKMFETRFHFADFMRKNATKNSIIEFVRDNIVVTPIEHHNPSIDHLKLLKHELKLSPEKQESEENQFFLTQYGHCFYDALLENYDRSMYVNVTARLAVGVFYTVGLIGIFIPTLSTFIRISSGLFLPK